MKQIVQNLKTGETILEEVPAPQENAGHILIQTTRSLVSLGTERMLVDFGKAGYIQKAKQQPEKVKQVLEKVRTDGLQPTYETVSRKLDAPLPLGYCNVGVVVEKSVARECSRIGANEKNDFFDRQNNPSEPPSGTLPELVHGASTPAGQKASPNNKTEENFSPSHPLNFSPSLFKPGERVVSNGPHAEVVRVPKDMCAKIPDNVSDEEAAFTVVWAIGLQGVRLARPTFGETFVVIGLGLIGLLTVQILRANACRVIGLDIDAQKLELAERFGARVINSAADETVSAVQGLTDGLGADGVLITASAKGSDIVSQAARMCRKRGRIVPARSACGHGGQGTGDREGCVRGKAAVFECG